MPVCPHCGHDTADVAARFCPTCGRPLVPEASGAEGATETTSAMRLGDPDGAPGVPGASGESAADGESDAASSAGVELDDPTAAMVERLQPGTALLLVRRGPASGARFLLDADLTTAGRHPKSDIFFDDITVSRHHAEFRRTADGFRLRDMGSLNGTYVNRSRTDEELLVGGDEVQIGKYRLLFLQAPPEVAEGAADAGGEV